MDRLLAMADACSPNHVGTATTFVTYLISRHVIPAETGAVIAAETGSDIRTTDAECIVVSIAGQILRCWQWL